MIFGIGTDIVSIERIRAGLQRHDERFARRILAEKEWDAFKKSACPAHFLAKRFAAKEAAAKAFGTGFRDGLSLRHIAVVNDHRGKPELCFSERADALREELGIGRHYLSLSDERDYAIAFVTFLEKE
ncbi:MAG: holo-ACP synthase [Gammaproteobacteria bacterium]|nr:holo-ACP synthase [Gammaproteobacteria bacterium]MCW8840972.1 holo-ACP synthase [Gammaproteobacteria bacterium]MCW8927867.1 holo-ACP synthase [Gammaproteobacteria bacterium]MCW8958727.1 holo-ACP synthase [Gammaproteobacteria bacterium]MCW8973261.1 holo-ACP synthase [Gammaproteobacteria bacterium]